MSHKWTKEEEAALKRAWLAGRSSASIARELKHVVSDHAVCGKAQRMGLKWGGTRSSVRLAAAIEFPHPTSPRKWTDELDALLAQSITYDSCGRVDWGVVAKRVGQSRGACKGRWAIILGAHAERAPTTGIDRLAEEKHINLVLAAGGFPRFAEDASGLMTRELVGHDGRPWRMAA